MLTFLNETSHLILSKNNNKSLVEESKQIVPDQTAPLGAVWSETILLALDFPVWAIWFLYSKNQKKLLLCLPGCTNELKLKSCNLAN